MNRGADRFVELVREFPLRPVKTRAQNARALKMLMKLLAKGEENFSRDESDYFETLAHLIERYERANVVDDFQPLHGVEMVRFLMNERGLNISALGKVIGSQTAASLVLSGKRELSKSMIVALSEYFDISPAVFFPKRRKAS